jgi:hypothetical protein
LYSTESGIGVDVAVGIKVAVGTTVGVQVGAGEAVGTTGISVGFAPHEDRKKNKKIANKENIFFIKRSKLAKYIRRQ